MKDTIKLWVYDLFSLYVNETITFLVILGGSIC